MQPFPRAPIPDYDDHLFTDEEDALIHHMLGL